MWSSLPMIEHIPTLSRALQQVRSGAIVHELTHHVPSAAPASPYQEDRVHGPIAWMHRIRSATPPRLTPRRKNGHNAAPAATSSDPLSTFINMPPRPLEGTNPSPSYPGLHRAPTTEHSAPGGASQLVPAVQSHSPTPPSRSAIALSGGAIAPLYWPSCLRVSVFALYEAMKVPRLSAVTSVASAQ